MTLQSAQANGDHSVHDHVIIVDENDREIGTEAKLHAHFKGSLHRAISVFVFDSTGEKLLLQQRAAGKYHSGGLWSNTCCSHPRPGESTMDAAHRRLFEELGFDCPLEAAFSFRYHANVSAELQEHEIDHVFVGRADVTPAPNAGEVAAVRWSALPDLVHDVAVNADNYSAWFGLALAELRARGWIVV
jgi:isopentenyl-diphosphate delta-isomerase